VISKVSSRKPESVEIADPFARKLVGRYLQNRTSDIQKLGDALEDEDFETIRTTGHNLFGSGSAYGLDEVSRIGEALENAAKHRDGPATRGFIAELADFLDRVEVC